jgi:REP element-mobilizing transposase RayT
MHAPVAAQPITKRPMPQSLAQIYLHLVFSTKCRAAFLVDPAIRKELHAYLVGICRNLGSPSLLTGGTADHVHILCCFSRGTTVSDFVRELKRDSSKWIKTKGTDLAAFHWQDGYGVFSVSPSHVTPLRQYIADQEAHHHKESYQDEFRRLLRKYGVQYDERYVWD